MARINQNNPLFNLSGKIGKHIYFQRNGRTYVKDVPNSIKPPTEKQLIQRMQFISLTTVLNSMRGFLKVGLANRAKSYGKEPYNLAVSLNWKNVFVGKYPDIEIDYSQLILSEGDLFCPSNISAQTGAKGIAFTWEFDKEDWGLSAKDRVMVLAYIPSLQKSIFEINGSTYDSECYELELKGIKKGVQIETFFAFVSRSGNDVSYTSYTGSFAW